MATWRGRGATTTTAQLSSALLSVPLAFSAIPFVVVVPSLRAVLSLFRLRQRPPTIFRAGQPARQRPLPHLPLGVREELTRVPPGLPKLAQPHTNASGLGVKTSTPSTTSQHDGRVDSYNGRPLAPPSFVGAPGAWRAAKLKARPRAAGGIRRSLGIRRTKRAHVALARKEI